MLCFFRIDIFLLYASTIFISQVHFTSGVDITETISEPLLLDFGADYVGIDYDYA